VKAAPAGRGLLRFMVKARSSVAQLIGFLVERRLSSYLSS